MMKSATEWAEKFNNDCEGFGHMKTRNIWEPSDFNLNFGEEFDPCSCHDDYGKDRLCDACKDNVNEFNKSILIISTLQNKIAKLEAFIHTKFPEFEITTHI